MEVSVALYIRLRLTIPLVTLSSIAANSSTTWDSLRNSVIHDIPILPPVHIYRGGGRETEQVVHRRGMGNCRHYSPRYCSYRETKGSLECPPQNLVTIFEPLFCLDW